MDRRGHAGFTLIVASLAAQALGLALQAGLLFISLSAVFSVLPDIDLRLEIRHRRYTHNLLVALLASALIGMVASQAGLGFFTGFVTCLLGYLCHILGDLLTYMSFPPLWPVVKKEVSLRLFRSSDRAVNSAFMFAGSLAFIAFIFKALG
ncbi:MAG: metal-dependent hydrolase [Candidatus Verstraetearchaeota archaeon]|nr:metal-dependent hydrolase [Candidatus Verstraetearchaeota archaeon]